MEKAEINKLEIFDKICQRIILGESLRAILRDNYMPTRQTFYNWIEGNQKLIDQYARATQARADNIFDEIIEISDHSEEDHTPFTGTNVIQRDRLKIDARKWALSKMNPKKYGEKVDITTDGEALNNKPQINLTINNEEIDLSS